MINTFVGLLVIEFLFFIGSRLARKHEFIVSLVLALIVFYFTFSNMVLVIFKHIIEKGNSFTLGEIGVIFFNMGYAYFRGLSRVFTIGKKENLSVPGEMTGK